MHRYTVDLPGNLLKLRQESSFGADQICGYVCPLPPQVLQNKSKAGFRTTEMGAGVNGHRCTGVQDAFPHIHCRASAMTRHGLRQQARSGDAHTEGGIVFHADSDSEEKNREDWPPLEKMKDCSRQRGREQSCRTGGRLRGRVDDQELVSDQLRQSGFCDQISGTHPRIVERPQDGVEQVLNKEADVSRHQCSFLPDHIQIQGVHVLFRQRQPSKARLPL